MLIIGPRVTAQDVAENGPDVAQRSADHVAKAGLLPNPGSPFTLPFRIGLNSAMGQRLCEQVIHAETP